MKATARANTNIALIKYWGKRNETLILPMNNSLSITLDKFYTETTVSFEENLQEDQFFLNGQLASEMEIKKITNFLNIVRNKAGITLKARIDSTNHVPTAAGFASSASGYAALATAAAKASGLNLSKKELSILARQGSGSACRSIYGGFVEWQKGEMEDGSDSYAVPIASDWKLSIMSVMLEQKQKEVLSREGMKRTVETSPFYAGWLATIEDDLANIKQAITNRDFELLGTIAENNALKMHATTLGANPPFLYWQSGTIEVMEKVKELRISGIPAFFTIDAGPNVKVLCEPQYEEQVYQTLSQLDAVQEIFTCHPGSGAILKEGI
ncbi:diphosphomevalonate decarboxylase [Bacillus kwashiorkori]|uniref:diphosphomevalonate decarboxylase n=1 Tax=Bacillus kwashiorkori TaxID=1522318 RepID=UPI0007813F35|nr:diphosphomevalonate decarboxylase [Bacillus kwashiorkori]